jgi:phenylalanine-4-hydroxylase
LDLIANRTLDAGTDLEADHPGFNDVEYRKRRAKLAEQALNHRMHHEIPKTEYTKEEVETWGLVWDTMEELWDAYACKEYKVRRRRLRRRRLSMPSRFVSIMYNLISCFASQTYIIIEIHEHDEEAL